MTDQIGFGEFGGMEMRVKGHVIKVWKEYSYTSNFLTPTDNWRFVVGDELLAPELIDLLIPGQRVEFFIDGLKQASGYIDIVDASGDRATGGQTITIEGRDTLAPLCDSQIDPDHKYPEKINLEKLILDTVEPFGFTSVVIDDTANREVKARWASDVNKPRKHKRERPDLKKFPVPKKKPQHNDSFFIFLSRITQRYGLWIWPTVDGDGLIVSSPDYDQDQSGELRRKADGAANNIRKGGIRRDSTDQPTFIVAHGDIPPTTKQHQRTRVVIDNPYVAGLEFGLSFQEQSDRPNEAVNGDILPANTGEQSLAVVNFQTQQARQDKLIGQLTYDPAVENKTFVAALARYHTEVLKPYTEIIASKPITIVNPYASLVARPRFLHDPDSHTIEELRFFARRQMSLCIRKAYVGKYTCMGHKLGGNIIQVNTILNVDDEQSRHKGPLWVQARTFEMSRASGCTTSMELLPLQAIQF